MPFDPTLPANNSPIVSAELRNQFNGLKTLMDAKPSSADMNAAINNAIQQNASANSNSVAAFDGEFSDPPTVAEMQALAGKLNELINQLRQPT